MIIIPYLQYSQPKFVSCACRVFMCLFHKLPYKSCHKYQMGKYVYVYAKYFTYAFPIPITNFVYMRNMDTSLQDDAGHKIVI